MKPKASALILLVSFTLASGSAARSGELSTRMAIDERIGMLLENSDFKTLEKMAGEFRRTQSRSSSGLWMLTLFYSGLDKYLTAHVSDRPFWSTMDRTIKRWMAEHAESPTPHLVYANLLIGRANSYRGGVGWIFPHRRDVAPFKRLIGEARKHLERAKEIASDDPRWYELMARIAMYQAWPKEEFSRLLEEASEKEPLFYQTYFMAVLYYAPGWYGSPGELESLANMALRRTKDQEGYALYARIYWYVSQVIYADALFKESKVNWSTMRKGIDDVLADYPDNWNINNFAKFACLAGDKGTTGALFAQMDRPIFGRVWRSDADYARCKSFGSSERAATLRLKFLDRIQPSAPDNG